MEIDVRVDNQHMRVESNNKRLVAGSQKFIKFKFNLSDDWDGLAIFAQFSQNDVGYNHYLDVNKCVYMPKEIRVGKCTLTLYGTGNNEIIATTGPLLLTIDDNGLVADGENIDITPSLYEQLTAKITPATIAEVKQYLGI